MMNRCLILLSVFIVIGCAPAEQSQRDELMKVIEQRVELPSGSAPLTRYARAYKFAEPERVTAVYFLPDNSFIEESCQSAKSSGRTNGQIVLFCPPPDGMRADESRWFENDVHLPDQMDGGCSFIVIEYSIALKTIISANCNGHA
jgi:hypothetical protein